MRILYLHGLETPPGGEKVDFLETLGECYAPAMDYRKQGAFEELLEQAESFKPDLVVGSSAGGYYGYHIANALSVNTILFNPAIYERVAEISPAVESISKNNLHRIICGKEDDVISPADTYFKLVQDKVKFDYTLREGKGHRTNYEEFVNEVKDYNRSLGEGI